MTTFNWLNRKGYYNEVQEYLTKGKEKALTGTVLGLSTEELEEYMDSCYPSIQTSDREQILSLIFNDLGIKYNPVTPTQEDYIEPNGSISLEAFITASLMYVAVLITIIVFLYFT